MGNVKLNSNYLIIVSSIKSISFFWKLKSVTYEKYFNCGGYIYSYFEAIQSDVVPRSCSYLGLIIILLPKILSTI